MIERRAPARAVAPLPKRAGRAGSVDRSRVRQDTRLQPSNVQEAAIQKHKRDESTGQDNLHLAWCFNEGCLNSQERREDLYYLVYPVGRRDQEPGPQKRA